MTIPLTSNVGFTEVDSSGSLNDKAGTNKTKLPIQFFRLTGAITGALTLDNNAAHKKIILDTNGNNIINDGGSPLTTNSSTTLELKGSGNVQSTKVTFTSSVDSTSNTGTTTIASADNSTVVVADDAHTFVGTFIDDDRSSHSGPAFGDGLTQIKRPNTNTFEQVLVHDTYYTTGYTALVGGTAMTNLDRADFGMSFTHAFAEDGTPISGRIMGPSTSGGTGGTGTFDGGTAQRPTTNSTHSIDGVTYRYMFWNNVISGVNNGNAGTFDFYAYVDVDTGKLVFAMTEGRGAFNQIKNVDVLGVTAGRRFTFTNNLAISCVLSGADPYDDVTVGAGATAVANRDSTDGSFNIIGTVSGSSGDNPYSTVEINDGTGSVNEDAYTGTKSVSAF